MSNDELKKLIDQMRDYDQSIRSKALKKLKKKGWLKDGSLKDMDCNRINLEKADLIGADLQGANLEWANLFGVELSRANLKGANLSHVHLSSAILTGADLSSANLKESNLSYAKLIACTLANADLTKAYLSNTDFLGSDFANANLSKTSLIRANLREVVMVEANLSEANLDESNIFRANLDDAILTRANLIRTTFNETRLNNADFTEAICLRTLFLNLDLSTAKGLETMRFPGPSTVGVDTLVKSKGSISEIFLRGCGVAEAFIHTSNQLNAEHTFPFCFIYYSSADEGFAQRVHNALQDVGARCWLVERNLTAEEDAFYDIDRGIRSTDKILLCCSKQALTEKWWIDMELNKARQKERKSDTYSVLTLDVDGFMFSTDYDAPRKDALGARVCGRFDGWENDQSVFEQGIAQIVHRLAEKQHTSKDK